MKKDKIVSPGSTSDAGDSSTRPRSVSRRLFLSSMATVTAAVGFQQSACSDGKKSMPSTDKQEAIQGLAQVDTDEDIYKGWVSVSDRKIRVGIIGHGLCKFGAAFGFQDHPNVEIVAVSDLFPDRCAELAKVCNCSKTYPSLEELVKDKNVEAVFIATDAASHGKHALEALNHGKHVGICVPATLGSLEEAEQLFETVKRTGLKYMMFETSCFHPDLYAMRQIYRADGFGKLVYSEGEYFHFEKVPLPSYKGWRNGTPPQWYGTHSNAYYIGITDGTFTEVSCMGVPSKLDWLQAENNPYRNPFGTEIAQFRTNEGGVARMAVSWDSPGKYTGVTGGVRGEKGYYYDRYAEQNAYDKYEGQVEILPNLKRPPIPPGVPPGGHSGSHGNLTDEFITAILQNRKPLIDVDIALNLTVPGIIAHQSALKDGELLKIPQYKI